MREILEVCQKCDMKYDMIDLHLSTTIVHINMRSSSSLLLLFLVFLGFSLKYRQPNTQVVALLIVTDNVSALHDDVKRCLCSWVQIFQ